MGGLGTEQVRLGLAVSTTSCRSGSTRTTCWLTRFLNTSAEELANEARELDRLAILVRDEQTGERLAISFKTLGWKIHRGLVMVHQRQPERTADTGLVHESTRRRCAQRASILGGEPWAKPEVVEQMLEHTSVWSLEVSGIGILRNRLGQPEAVAWRPEPRQAQVADP